MPEMQQRGSLISAAASSPPVAPEREDGDPHKPSSIPPWVHLNDGSVAEEDALLLAAPGSARPNTRHYRPPPTHYKPGRKWDHLRSAEPPLLSAPIAEHQERWRPFMYSGPNPQEQQAQARVVDQAWMQENMPYLNEPWKEEDEWAVDAHVDTGRGFSGLMYRGKWLISPERQERTVRVFWRLLLKNAFVPLAFRITILAFSATSLGIAAKIFEDVNHVNNDGNANNQCATRASTYMAIIVSSVAVPYLGFITWDEYMSKPLGLRGVAAKTLLLLCDLYFVVFSASNLSLAFDALYDHRWACYDEQFTIIGSHGPEDAVPTCPNNRVICNKQKALVGILFVGLIAWLITFSISVLRVVEKLRPD